MRPRVGSFALFLASGYKNFRARSVPGPAGKRPDGVLCGARIMQRLPNELWCEHRVGHLNIALRQMPVALRRAPFAWSACALVICGLSAAPPLARAGDSAVGGAPAATNAVRAATRIYVAAGGSDTNPGTESAPFRTIQRAANVAKPGTTVYVGPGTYRENVRHGTHGTAAARIRFVSSPKWSAKLIGSGTEAAWINNGDYTELIGFDISGSGRLGVLNWGSHTLMSGNHVHDIAVSGGCTGNGGAGIMNANYRGTDNDVIGNLIHDIGQRGSCNGVQGIYHANLRGHIYNNTVYRVSSFAIHLWHAANNVVIANNTLFANGTASMGGGILLGSGGQPGGVMLNHTQVVNNIVYDNPAASIQEYCDPGQRCIGPSNTIAGNLVYGNGNGILLLAGSAKGTIAADPQFVNYQANGKGDYRLKRTSPAINNGLSFAASPSVLEHATRSRGGAPDIGAQDNY